MMKHTYCYRLLTVALLSGAWGILPGTTHAQQSNETQQQSVLVQQLFTSPDEAVKALQAATQANDKEALKGIFGPQIQELLTGDQVQDANNAQKFATAMAQGNTLVKEGDDKITIEVGPNNWPMPVPLIKVNGQWLFDTAAGKEEIINRHIGKDELTAIGVCRAYVIAQQQYASMNPEGAQGIMYARRFKSKLGKKDGLYWPTSENEQASPFGPVVAQATAEGYGPKSFHPFHGYFFKILTRQGKDAPGGEMNYKAQGNLTGGFALVAYPQYWDKSGVMTFIVNQDGKVYQQNLGENTFKIAKAMKEYDPDNKWTLVQDEGVLSEVSKK